MHHPRRSYRTAPYLPLLRWLVLGSSLVFNGLCANPTEPEWRAFFERVSVRDFVFEMQQREIEAPIDGELTVVFEREGGAWNIVLSRHTDGRFILHGSRTAPENRKGIYIPADVGERLLATIEIVVTQNVAVPLRKDYPQPFGRHARNSWIYLKAKNGGKVAGFIFSDHGLRYSDRHLLAEQLLWQLAECQSADSSSGGSPFVELDATIGRLSALYEKLP